MQDNTISLDSNKVIVSNPDQLITLTYGQLNEIISRAVCGAQERQISQGKDIQDLKEEIEALKRELRSQTYRIDDAFEAIEDIDKTIAKLGTKEPTEKQTNQSEILRSLLASYGGKMLAKEARQKMGLPENRFSELLNKMDQYIEVRPYKMDKRKRLLVLKSKLLPKEVGSKSA